MTTCDEAASTLARRACCARPRWLGRVVGDRVIAGHAACDAVAHIAERCAGGDSPREDERMTTKPDPLLAMLDRLKGRRSVIEPDRVSTDLRSFDGRVLMTVERGAKPDAVNASVLILDVYQDNGAPQLWIAARLREVADLLERDAAREAAAEEQSDLDEIIAYVLGPGWTRRAYEVRMDGGVTMWTRPSNQRLRLTVDRDCYTLAASSTPGVWVEATTPLTHGQPDAADFEVDLTRLAGDVGWDVVDDD